MTRTIIIFAMVGAVFAGGWTLGRKVLLAEQAIASREAIETRDENKTEVEGWSIESLIDYLAR